MQEQEFGPDRPTGESDAQMRDRLLRQIATEIYLLPIVCTQPACRRARACKKTDAPCLRRYRHLYEDVIPPLPVLIKQAIAELDAREAKA